MRKPKLQGTKPKRKTKGGLHPAMRALSMDELRAVISAAETQEERLMIKVTRNHALRATEVCELEGAQIQHGYVDVQRLKGSLHTVQPYVRHDDPLLDESKELAELAKRLGPKDRVFPNMTRFKFHYFFKKAALKAGLPAWRARPHALKHSAVTAMVQAGDIAAAREWAGHTTLESTGYYCRMTPAEVAVKALKALGACAPVKSELY